MELRDAVAPTEGLPAPSDVTVPETSVVALIVTAGNLRHELHTGLMATMNYDRVHGWGNYRGELIHTSGANISKARNEIIRRFLDETDAEWAWLLDSDMAVKPDTLPQLLCAAAVSGAKVMGGLCCMIGDDGPIPTLFQLGDPNQGEVTRVMLDYEPNAVVQVAATGMACLLIHRSVLEHFRDTFPNRNYPWIFEDEINGQWVSEDVLFSLRCNEAGFPVFVATFAEIGHVKGGKTWWPSDIRRGRGFPPSRTVAIIPTKRWGEDFLALWQQLHEDDNVDRIIVLNNSGTPRWESGDRTTVLDMPGAGIHEMWNRAVEHAAGMFKQRRNLNLLFLNDDLKIDGRFVRRMVEALRSDPELVAVSGNYDGRQGQLVEYVTDICAGRYDGTGGFAGFGFAVKAEWFQSGYRFPEQCKWWFGDNDLVTAAGASGCKVGIAVDAPMEHLDGGSKTGGDWSGFTEQIKADQEAYERRWAAFAAANEPKDYGKVVVVSAIYGGYDDYVTPAPQPEVTDWCIVTDSDRVPPKPWRAIHKEIPGDPRYAAKAAKYQPFEHVQADVAIWIDGRVEPLPGFARWLLDCLGDADMAIYRHWGRSSILAEAEACLIENPDKYQGRPMIEQARHYLVDGYEDVNLWQTTFFAIRDNERTRAMGKRWQEEQDRFPDCLLDQIPLPPVIAECGVNVVDLPGGFWDYRGKYWNLRPHVDGT